MTHPYTYIKNAIRRARTPDTHADAGDVKELLANHDDHDAEDLLAAYEQAKREGEIFEYPDDDGNVVRITDEVMSA